jgi:hypothetical protein
MLMVRTAVRPYVGREIVPKWACTTAGKKRPPPKKQTDTETNLKVNPTYREIAYPCGVQASR